MHCGLTFPGVWAEVLASRPGPGPARPPLEVGSAHRPLLRRLGTQDVHFCDRQHPFPAGKLTQRLHHNCYGKSQQADNFKYSEYRLFFLIINFFF